MAEPGHAVFGELCDELELPRIGVHGLRHSVATFMVGAGVSPKLVAQRLGHSSPAITLGVYSHVMPGHDQAAAGHGGHVRGAAGVS